MVVTNSITTKDGNIVCRAAYSFLPDTSNSNLIQEGTKCAPNKVCIDRKCQDEALFNVKSCHDKCNHRGVCNENNNCHCEKGWAPPFCDKRGHGGSTDSGSETPTKKEKEAEKMANLIPLAIIIMAPALGVPILGYTLRNCKIKKKTKPSGRAAVKTVQSAKSSAPLVVSAEVHSHDIL